MPRTCPPTATTKIFTPDLLSACALGMVRCFFLFDLPSVTRKTIFLALTRRPLGRELHHIVSSKSSNGIFAGNDRKNSSIWFMGRCTLHDNQSHFFRHGQDTDLRSSTIIMTTTVAFFFSIHLIAF